MKKDKGYTEDIAKYKKKSKNTGRKRSKHKHKNIYVKLYEIEKKEYWHKDFAIGEVCSVCGRVNNIYLGFLDWRGAPKVDINSLPEYEVKSFFESGIHNTAYPRKEK